MSPKRKKQHLQHMQKEKDRLATFVNYPSDAPLLPSMLASAGFYHPTDAGLPDEVVCFSCGCHLSDWEADHDPRQRHQEVNPQCAVLTNSQNGNIPFGPIHLPGYSSSAGSRAEASSIATASCITHNSQQPLHSASNFKPFTSTPLQQTVNPQNELNHRETSNSGRNGRHTHIDHAAFNGYSPSGVHNTSSIQPCITNTTASSQQQRLDQLKRERVRLDTFSNWPADTPVDKYSVAKAGFYHIGPGDRVRCAFCYNVLRMWEEGDIPEREHKKYFPRCPLLVAPRSSGNIPSAVDTSPSPSLVPQQLPANSVSTSLPTDTSSTNGNLGVMMSRPHTPRLALETSRMDTFSTWPEEAPMSPHDLAKAGFFYTGNGDLTRCFFCNMALRLWKADDDVWEEHARWQPRCGFIKMMKGEAFIEEVKHKYALVQSVASASQATSGLSTDPLVNRRTLYDMMRSDIVKEAIRLGKSKKLISRVIERRLQANGGPCVDISSLLCELNEQERLDEGELSSEMTRELQGTSVKPFENQEDHHTNTKTRTGEILEEENEEHASLLEENIRLKESQMCKICMDKEVDIVFLPCGHLVCCGNCASAVNICPICRQMIRGTVKIFKP